MSWLLVNAPMIVTADVPAVSPLAVARIVAEPPPVDGPVYTPVDALTEPMPPESTDHVTEGGEMGPGPRRGDGPVTTRVDELPDPRPRKSLAHGRGGVRAGMSPPN